MTTTKPKGRLAQLGKMNRRLRAQRRWSEFQLRVMAKDAALMS